MSWRHAVMSAWSSAMRLTMGIGASEVGGRPDS
jgi:hypothetical protein